VAREVFKKFLVTPLYLISLTRREFDMRMKDSMIIHLLVLLPLGITSVSSKPNTEISLKRQRELLRTSNLQTIIEIYVFGF